MKEFIFTLVGIAITIIVLMVNYNGLTDKVQKQMIVDCVYGFDPALRESTGQADFKVTIVDGKVTHFECIEMDRPPLNY